MFCTKAKFGEREHPTLDAIESAIACNPGITHVGMVHSETSSGLLNPLEIIGPFVKKLLPKAEFIVVRKG